MNRSIHPALLPVDQVCKDPFDRLLVAQSRIEAAPIVSADTALDAFRIERIRDERPSS